ncbi:hypothetical protein PAXRUDRAFT_255247, partial [Paxillus rubicundulus Ve08.2h10]
ISPSSAGYTARFFGTPASAKASQDNRDVANSDDMGSVDFVKRIHSSNVHR